MDGHHNSWDTGMLDHGEVSLSEQGTSGSIFCHGHACSQLEILTDLHHRCMKTTLP